VTVLRLAVVTLAFASFLLALLATLWFAVWFVSRGLRSRERFTLVQTMNLLGPPAIAAAWALGVLVGRSEGFVLRPSWLQHVVLIGIPAALGMLLGVALAARRAHARGARGSAREGRGREDGGASSDVSDP